MLKERKIVGVGVTEKYVDQQKKQWVSIFQPTFPKIHDQIIHFCINDHKSHNLLN